MVKKISDLYLEARRAFLTQEDANYAGFLARNILCHVTGKTQEQILADKDTYVNDETCQKMSLAVQRILNGEPLAYVIGQWEFYGMTLQVDNHVLIPRDDTCAVTALAIRQALFLDSAPRLLDLCTGSGCVGI